MDTFAEPRPSRAAPFRPTGGGRRRFAFLGAAALVSVGYVDPGNWATDIEGGARFGYQLLWVLVGSGLIATLLQTLSARLGVVTGLDLAAACRDQYDRRLRVPLWVLAELAIIACDMAEVLGSAVALNMLFQVPLIVGALLTGLDVFVLLILQRQNARGIEIIVTTLMLVIAGCLGAQVFWAQPNLSDVARGLVPRIDGHSLFIAIGMLGATVMPHNLYLHSAIVPKRDALANPKERRTVLRKCFTSTATALSVALFLNAAILIVASSAFFTREIVVTDLGEAHQLLTPLLGTGLASVLFAVALLCSGQSSTITGTLAGQAVMEGFMRWRLSPVTRRAVTRGIAIVPAVVVLGFVGQAGTMLLLIASQVVLSLQLPFAVVPLVRFTSSAHLMGRHANTLVVKTLAIICAVLVTGANAVLVTLLVVEWHASAPILAYGVGAAGAFALMLLMMISVAPLRAPQKLSEGRFLTY